MALFFLGMMLCTNKSDEGKQTSNNTESSQQNEPQQITEAAWAQLPQRLREGGEMTVDESGKVYSYSHKENNANVTLKLVNDSIIDGIVEVDSITVNAYDVYLNHLASDTILNQGQKTRAYKALQTTVSEIGKYGPFARALNVEEDTSEVVLKNDVLKVGFSTRGGYMVDATLLSKYKTYFPVDSNKNVIDTTDVKVFDRAYQYGFTFNYNNNKVSTDRFVFKPYQVNDSTVEMIATLGNGATWGYRYTLPQGDSYVVHMEVIQTGMENIFIYSPGSMRFNWMAYLPHQERGASFEERNSGMNWKFVGDSPEEFTGTESISKEFTSATQWVALKNQFFSSVFIPSTPFNGCDLHQKAYKAGEVKSLSSTNADDYYIKRLEANMGMNYNPTEASVAEFDIFIGPNSYPLLKDIDNQVGQEDLYLTRLVPLGWSWLRWINTLIVIPVFNFLSGITSNYGLIILLLTIFIKIILFPFTYKSYLSQAKMRLLAPEIKEINDKYPGQENAMVRQQKTMALYNKAGASPFSGCLPLLLQMPILIAMFSFFPSCIELRGQSFLWVQDLAAPDYICTLPFSIPLFGDKVSLFCLLMTVTNVVYTRINMANQPSSSSMPGMKWMMYLMPLMFLFFFNQYPAALSYYYFLSLLITIIQTWVFRRCVNEDKLRRKMAENAAKPKKRSGFMARLEEAQRKQQAAMREQQKRRH